MLSVDNYTPFFGVIEDIKDPEMLGRIRVRCYGYHTENVAFIPTDLLQWFYPIANNSAGMSGIGSSMSYKQGATVFGFFTDRELQNGIVLGSIFAKPTPKTLENMGFTDPDKSYPFYYDESDINRIARNENIDKTIIEYKKTSRVTDIPSATDGTWDEPETPYDAEYPNNHVFETTSGHVVEYDDTVGAERISINHKSGTFQEMHPDGTRVDKTNGDQFSIFLGGNFIFVNGNLNQVIGGDHEHHVMGDYILKVGGKCVIDSDDLDVLGDLNVSGEVNIGNDVSINGDLEVKDITSGNISGKSIKGSSVEGGGVNLKSHKHGGVTSGGAFTIAAIGLGFSGGGNGGSYSGDSPSDSVSYSVEVTLFDPEIRKSEIEEKE